MIIETKYNKGNVVYVIQNGTIKKVTIHRIGIVVGDYGDITITYFLEPHGGWCESEDYVYYTKKEAGQSWIEQQGLDCGLY
jgi:hypothetical protein